MAHRIDTVEGRNKLQPRPGIYWDRLSAGQHLGLRKMSAASDGTWIARAYDPATRKQSKRALGAFDDIQPARRYDEAKKAAEAWFEHLGRGGSLDTVTVKQACAAYVKHVRATNEKAADDMQARYRRWVDSDTIGSIELQKLNKTHVRAWRKRLQDAPVVIDPHAKNPRTRKRSDSALNRDMTALRAALNHALDEDFATTDVAWRVALKPIKNADGRRNVYLDRDQRRKLIEKAPADVARFLKGLALVPLRPGALAALTVANFDKRLGVLVIGKDKAGEDRSIKLPPATAAFFAEQTTKKLPAAPLFARADGLAWSKDAWKKPIKAAAQDAALPAATSAYALRHSVITDLVTGGLDTMTVATLAGTSIVMIERHYGHLCREHAAAALARLAL